VNGSVATNNGVGVAGVAFNAKLATHSSAWAA
jgi:hypothetical protein